MGRLRHRVRYQHEVGLMGNDLMDPSWIRSLKFGFVFLGAFDQLDSVSGFFFIVGWFFVALNQFNRDSQLLARAIESASDRADR